ncbi:MAG TPA: TldD/PmbA family protein [Candidatus Limnocylindrales bacterium]|nr:TldD/PmbA family protein [Candidatus Limnocylindrales bacterium]
MSELNGRTPADVLALAERVLGFAETESPTELEVVAMADDGSLTRFANSEIHQNVAESNVQVNLRFVAGKRVGVASTNRSDDEGLRLLAERAAAIARNSEELDDWGGLPEPTVIRPVPEGYATATAEASPELRADGVRAVIAAADVAGVKSYGSFSTATETLGIANSKGIRASGQRTISQLLTVAMAPDGGSGYAESAAVDVTAIDAADVGRQAAEKAKATGNPVAVDHGDWPVILEEYAVVDLLSMLGYMGFSALAVQEERSFSEPGRKVGSELVSIVDDGTDPATLPMAFDYEGVAKERVSLIERGVCRDVVYDAQTAARAGRRSTGHGLPAPNPYGPFPLNMAMAAGETPREDLVKGLERGLLVTRFHYTNPVHPKLAIVTGMTRDGTFYVEDGRIKGPVRNLRFTQSYLEALAATSAISRERRTLKGDFGGVLVPAIRVDSWTFTGATEH